jgi:membrane protease YdiL (CAAX protease family)
MVAIREMTTITHGSDSRPLRNASVPFVLYVVVFHLLWAAWPFFLYPRVRALGDRTLLYAIANLGIRFTVWVLPVLGYLRFVDGVEPLQYLKLTGHVRRGLVVGAVLTGLNLVGMVLRFGLPTPSLARVTWNSVLGTSILVGFIEEIPYRGFMLQKFEERLGFRAATLITSMLFVAVHLPGWIALHMLRADAMLSIFIFGVVMAIARRYAESLWAPIVTHSTNDFLSFVVFGV